jgi:hypothetical protein
MSSQVMISTRRARHAVSTETIRTGKKLVHQTLPILPELRKHYSVLPLKILTECVRRTVAAPDLTRAIVWSCMINGAMIWNKYA